MNKVDKEFNRSVSKMVENMLSASADEYMEMKITLLSKTQHDEKLSDFIHKLIAFTDIRRPSMIEKKEGAAV